MSRYVVTKTIKDDNGKRKKATTIFPNIPVTENDQFIITTTADRLDKLADIFYDDQNLWWVIAASNGLGKGTLIVPANTKLRIPVKQDFSQQITLINKTR